MTAAAARRLCTSTLIGILFTGSAAAASDGQDRTEQQTSKSIVEIALGGDASFSPATMLPAGVTSTTPAQPLLRAQPTVSRFEAPALRRSLMVSFGALQALDAHSTIKALSGGAAREANPALAGIASNRTALVAVKAGTAAATVYFAERLAKKHPRRATVLLTVLNSVYVAIVAHNYHVARDQ